MTVTFKIAQKSDLPEIVRIYNQAVPTFISTADIKPVTLAEREDWFAAHDPKRRPLWLILDDEFENPVVGWLSLSDLYQRFAYYPSVEISIYIDEKARHHHLAELAVKHAEAEAPKYNIKNIVALIFSHNAASIGLFKKLGYETWGHLPNACVLDGKYASVDFLGKTFLDEKDIIAF